MPKRTRDHDAWLLEELSDPVTAANYLSVANRDSHELFLLALRNVLQARTVAKIARDAGVAREALYRATTEKGNPELLTLRPVLHALGIGMEFVALGASSRVDVPHGTRTASASVGRRRGRSSRRVNSPMQAAFDFSVNLATADQPKPDKVFGAQFGIGSKAATLEIASAGIWKFAEQFRSISLESVTPVAGSILNQAQTSSIRHHI